MELSKRRARNVKEVLVREFSIDGSRLQTAGWGEDKPAASNSTAAGRKKNRRVEAVIVSK
jgi:OOP family OmpA-OmpF porin